MDLPSPDLVRASLYADSLRDYIEGAWPLVEQKQFKPNWHIDAIAEHLEAVSNGDLKRLIINIPPRHGKSLLCDVFWPTWEWLKRPHTQFMFFSYAQRLTTRDSLKCRRIVESVGGRRAGGTMLERIGYQGLLDLIDASWELTPDQREKLRFENDHFGYRIATSIGGVGTGDGGDVLVVDDPHKADEVESETERENVIDWLDGTLSTRLNDPANGAVVLVMQRLHEADATGHLLGQGGWEHLCLPAEYEAAHPFVWPKDPRVNEGELLWPDHFTKKALDGLKVSLQYRAAGQLQQRPAPAEGFLFKRSNFRYWRMEEAPIGAMMQRWYVLPQDDGSELRVDTGLCTVYQVVDVAMSERETADYTVVGTLAIAPTPIRNLLVLNVARRHFEQQETIMFLADENVRAGRVPMWIERFGAGRNPLAELRRLNHPVMEIPAEAGTQSDKLTRAFGAISLYQQHRVFHPPLGAETGWRDDFEGELTSFPNAVHDDQVDMISYGARLLEIIGQHQAAFRARPPGPSIRTQRF